MGLESFESSNSENSGNTKENKKPELDSIGSMREAKEALDEFKDEKGHYPKTYTEWDEHKSDLGYSTSAQNFKQNTGKTMKTIVEIQKDSDNLVTCLDCGQQFKTLGGHLSQTECEYHNIDSITWSMLKGLWLSDGWIAESTDGKYILHVEMINKKFLKWFKRNTRIPFSDIKLKKTASESSVDAKESGFSEKASPENYSDIYRMNSMAHPQLSNLADMDRSEVDLDENLCKIWYCGDGSVHWAGDYSFIQITTSGTVSRVEKLTKQLESMGYSTEIDEIRGTGKVIRFDKKSSSKFLSDIGEASPGFEYKWELSNRDIYEKLKNEVAS